MSIYQILNDNETIFKQLKQPPLIANDILETSEEEKETLKNAIYTRYEADLISNLPTCPCRHTKGEFNVGVVCTECKLPVTRPMESDVDPIMWMRSPLGVAKLINPMVWTQLTKRFTRSGFDVIQWICDLTYRTHVKTPAVIGEIQESGIIRGGYNYFVENFDFIIQKLFTLKSYRLPKGKKDELQELLEEYPNCIFSRWLPLPNKSLLVIEDTNVGTWLDNNVIGAIDAMFIIASVDSPTSKHSLRTKENRTIKAIVKLAEFSHELYKTTLAGKPGIFRKHGFGSRSHFAFRAVISSLTGPHTYDEIHIPWTLAASVFKLHLINKLYKLNYTPNEAVAFIHRNAQRYEKTNPESILLESLFNQLIQASPKLGIPTIVQRN